MYTPDPEGGTASVSHEVDTNKLGCITFGPGGMYTINWGTLDQESESNKSPTCETNKVQRKPYKCLNRPDHIISN